MSARHCFALVWGADCAPLCAPACPLSRDSSGSSSMPARVSNLLIDWPDRIRRWQPVVVRREGLLSAGGRRGSATRGAPPGSQGRRSAGAAAASSRWTEGHAPQQGLPPADAAGGDARSRRRPGCAPNVTCLLVRASQQYLRLGHQRWTLGSVGAFCGHRIVTLVSFYCRFSCVPPCATATCVRPAACTKTPLAC